MIRLISVPVGWLPAAWRRGLGRLLGWGWYRLVPVRRAVARENLRRALPALDRERREAVVAGMYRHLGESFLELLAFGGRSAEALRPRLQISGEAHLRRALAGGRGVLVLAAHLGNWELLLRAGLLSERPIWVISKRLRTRWAQRAWGYLRRGGPGLLPAEGSARAIVSALRRNEIVGFVIDQHCPSPRAVVAPFFGRPAATNPGLARLARSTGAPVLPIFAFREPAGRHRIVIDAPLATDWSGEGAGELARDVWAFTARCSAALERAIRQAPEQWLWIHRRWKVPEDQVPESQGAGSPSSSSRASALSGSAASTANQASRAPS